MTAIVIKKVSDVNADFRGRSEDDTKILSLTTKRRACRIHLDHEILQMVDRRPRRGWVIANGILLDNLWQVRSRTLLGTSSLVNVLGAR